MQYLLASIWYLKIFILLFTYGNMKFILIPFTPQFRQKRNCDAGILGRDTGRVIDVRWIKKSSGSSYNPKTFRVYISQKCGIKVGDKVAGRHGNKGIISKILPRQDMPYLQDGRSIDIVFNPLGVPSRMNRYEQNASRKLVFSELYEANKKIVNPWVFEPEYPGKNRIFDGRTGNPFEQPVKIGKPYILKLIHQDDDKIHGRSSGHYALEVLGITIIRGTIPNPEDIPESFRLLARELRSLALELNHFLLRIGSVSPQQISVWATKMLPNVEIVGEVTKPYTFHYKTNKLEKNGLFCERIFGPIKIIGDEKEDSKFCEQYRVGFVDSQIRRYQMGYIKLSFLVTHMWYLKGLPSYIANLLDKPLKELEGLTQKEKLSSQSIQLGCPGPDMSLGKSNMKLKIGV
ncbi:hypothetical protein H5410_046362 [Solanum commersonii]|uniref:DNA-directed RNA polymerase n=1 Tax=Solanum commersonii TaxID=4109 RepID=A0A9J5XG98_SOLCO|nr:hypothetical protein H5410_046362 [Solanum commersonii]